MPVSAPEVNFATGNPDMLVMALSGLPERECRYLAQDAVFRARQRMPRVSGRTASRLAPFYDDGWVGIWFPDAHTWFMEQGTRPRTMRSLAGKTIPMWIDDVDGSLRQKNPKAQVRSTEDGRTQVLIFRRAARIGQRKTTRKVNKQTGAVTTTSVPASYPGAPGRINRRNAAAPFTPAGLRGGAVGLGNSGVRWRHPGIRAMGFLNEGLAEAVFDAGELIGTVYAVDNGSWPQVRARHDQRAS